METKCREGATKEFVGNEIRNNYIKSRSCNFIVSTAWKNNWEAEYNDLNSFEGFLALEEEAMLCRREYH